MGSLIFIVLTLGFGWFLAKFLGTGVALTVFFIGFIIFFYKKNG